MVVENEREINEENGRNYKMSANYKQGYADGVSDLRNRLMVQIHDVLQQEKFHSKSLSKSTKFPLNKLTLFPPTEPSSIRHLEQ